MTKRDESAFAAWFRAQFGPAPMRDFETVADERHRTKALLHDLERELDQIRNYNESMRATLYAWNAARTS